MMRMFPFILPILFTAFAVLGVAFLVWPKYQDFTEVRGDSAEYRERIQGGEEISARLRETKRAIESKQENFGKIDIAIPSEVAVAGIYHEVQQMAAASGLILTSVSESSAFVETSPVPLQKSTLSLALEGSWGGMKNFLLRVQSSARMLNVQAVNIEGQDTAGTLRIQVEVEAYGAS